MKPNVRIVTRERGKIKDVREVHNTWTQYGREWLTQMVGLSAHGPDVTFTNDRIKYVGFGIGGKEQSQFGMASAAPWTTSYPIGADPNGSNGHEYDDNFPTNPLITTLERPVHVVGGGSPSSAYALPLTSGWRMPVVDVSGTTISQPISHPHPVYGYGSSRGLQYAARSNTRFFVQFRQNVGNHSYLGTTYYINDPWTGPNDITAMPLSEAGLYLDSAAAGDAFAPVVAYVTFPTVQITVETDLELEWDVRF